MSVKKVSDGDISKLKQEIYVEGRIISAWEHIEEVSEPVMEHARQVTEMPKNFIVNEEETMLTIFTYPRSKKDLSDYASKLKNNISIVQENNRRHEALMKRKEDIKRRVGAENSESYVEKLAKFSSEGKNVINMTQEELETYIKSEETQEERE